jgi:hypothetical protein
MNKWNPFWLFFTELGRVKLLAFIKSFVKCSSEHGPLGLSVWWMYLCLAVGLTSAATGVSSFGTLFTPVQYAIAFVLSYVATVCLFLWLFYLDYHPSTMMEVNVKKLRAKCSKLRLTSRFRPSCTVISYSKSPRLCRKVYMRFLC